MRAARWTAPAGPSSGNRGSCGEHAHTTVCMRAHGRHGGLQCRHVGARADCMDDPLHALVCERSGRALHPCLVRRCVARGGLYPVVRPPSLGLPSARHRTIVMWRRGLVSFVRVSAQSGTVVWTVCACSCDWQAFWQCTWPHVDSAAHASRRAPDTPESIGVKLCVFAAFTTADVVESVMSCSMTRILTLLISTDR